MTGDSVRRLSAVVIVVAAAGFAAYRAPDAFRDFRNGAASATGRNGLDGAIAGAHSLALDDGFVAAAVQQVPLKARYAVLGPPSVQVAQKTYGIDPITLEALPGFMLEILLPRLPVKNPVVGNWVLCYDCDTSPWDQRTRWIWIDRTKGYAIGRVYR